MPLGDDSHRSRGAQGLPRTHTRGFDEERTRVLGLVFGILGAQRINGLESCHLWDQRDHTNDLAGSPLCEGPRSKANLPPFSFSKPYLLHSSPKINTMAAKALADVRQARLRAAGLDDTLPSARPPSPALPPAKSSKQGARSKKNRTGTIVSSTAFLDAKSAGVASFVTSTRLSHFRRT